MAGGRSGGPEGRATPSLPRKALVLQADAACDLAARRAAEGAIVLAVDERAEAALEKAGIPHRRASAGRAAFSTDPAVRILAPGLGRLPLVDGPSFRGLPEGEGGI